MRRSKGYSEAVHEGGNAAAGLSKGGAGGT